MKTIFATLVALILLAGLSGSSAPAGEPAGPNPFFALSNGVIDDAHPTPESQAALLAELGYDGIGPSGTRGVPEMLAALDRHGLKMYALYIGANVDPDQPKYDPGLPAAIEQLAGRQTFIWLFVQGRKFPRGSDEGDARTVKIVGEVADLAAKQQLRVALYPHTGFYIQSVEGALRICQKARRDNLGVTFNLCHWLHVGSDHSMKELMELAMPHLYVVTINGADAGGEKSWSRLIQPLGQGSFDVAGFLGTLHGLGFRGPVGLQCYGVPGNKRENLKQSIKAWRAIWAKLEQ